MPHITLQAAEKAAIEGENPDIDSQDCRFLQDDLLSSPTNTPHHVASHADAIIQEPSRRFEVQDDEEAADDKNPEEELQSDAHDAQDHEVIDELIQLTPDPIVQPAGLENDRPPTDDAVLERREEVARFEFKRDHKGKLRRFIIEGEEYRDATFEERHRAVTFEETQRVETMDDLTQKSSMSLTQENPESAYRQFNIQQIIHDECPSTATPDDGERHDPVPNPPQDSLHSKQHASARTESTAYTYQEQDTGHVKLDFEPEIMDDDMDDMDDEQSQSQDASFAAPQFGMNFSAPTYDPQTPAAPVNPFSQKGSVMKGFELFGATQPSSIARPRSPTSSRPSPDVYNDFTSPPKRQRISSSPLTRLYEQNAESSPLQSSVRNLLAATVSSDFPESTVPRTSGVQSFDVVRSNSLPDPRPYVSMKESQERRRPRNLGSDSDTDGSDSDGDITRKRKRERESRIQRELSTVALPPRRVPVPIPPQSSASPAVEVPSTGRRRSVQEDYLAQCEGLDARDTQQGTQQDDYIADSQGAADQARNSSGRAQQSTGHLDEGTGFAVSDTPSRSPRKVYDPTDQSQEPDELPEDERVEHSDQHTRPHNSEGTKPVDEQSQQEPSLPLKESSGNRSNVRTPIAPKDKDHILSDGVETVPETSQPEQRLRTLGEIATISFQEAPQIDMSDLPGFTQDTDFEKAMRVGSPHRPISRPRSFRSSPLASAAPGVIGAPARLSELAEEPTSSSDVPSTLPGEGKPSLTKLDVPPTSIPDNDVLPALGNELKEPMIPDPDVLVPQAQAELEGVEGTDNEDPKKVAEDAAMGSDSREEMDGDVTESTVDTPNSKSPGTNLKDVLKIDTKENTPEPSTAKVGLRSKPEPKGPAKSLRSSARKSTASTGSARVMKTKATKVNDTSSASSTPTPTPRGEAEPVDRSVTRSQGGRGKIAKLSTPAPTAKRTSKRQSGVTVIENDETPLIPTRASKRHSTANLSREDSEDPITAAPTSAHKNGKRKSESRLFEGMAFAVSYVKNDHEKDKVTKCIVENGARLLQDGFDTLFDAIPKNANEDVELSLSESASSLGFTALIADEHSRKAKFMQALALGLPCISGRWVTDCEAKRAIVDWTPYLLCAGQSSFLGNVVRSRTIRPYPASEAALADVFSERDRFLEGKSILFVTGKGKTEDKRKAYIFLTRALGPARVGQAVDYHEARKRLVDGAAQDQTYDLLYVEKDEKVADSVVFGSGATASKSTKKRKRGPVEPSDGNAPPPKKIRIICDETMVQSLILGQLLEEDV